MIEIYLKAQNEAYLFFKEYITTVHFCFREQLEMMIDQLKIKLQDSQTSLQISISELHTLQSEHDTLLERHNRMLQETVTKEAELREK
jgi:regulator of replication initiation timing